MRIATAMVLAAAVLAGCDRGGKDQSVEAPAKHRSQIPAPPAPKAAYARPSGEECAIVAAYVKVDLQGLWGMQLMGNMAPEPQAQLTAAELRRDFPELQPAQAEELSQVFTRKLKAGESLYCDWKALGAPEPRLYVKGDSFMRVRPAINAAGDIAVLDIFTTAEKVMSIGTRCLYRKTPAGWTRGTCVPTQLG